MSDDQDVWVQHAPVIKKLYQDDGKTLKEVKSIMEGQYGFPRTPLSIYEARLRHHHGLQKRLKAKDWPRIYHYARANGFDKFDVVLNGTVIPWIKAWKEIRRSGVARSRLPVDHNATLPDKVEIRKQESISPQSSGQVSTLRMKPQTLAPQANFSLLFTPCHDKSQVETIALNTPNYQSLVLQRSGNFCNAVASRAAFDSESSLLVTGQRSVAPQGHTNDGEIITAQFKYLFAMVNLETIPWNQYRLKLYSMRNGGKQVPIEYRQTNGQWLALMPADGFFGHVPKDLSVPISSSRYPTACDLVNTCLNSGNSTVHFTAYTFLAQIVYVVSNGDVDFINRGDFIQLLDNLAKRVPLRLTSSIFKSSSMSIRAVWEQLFYKAFSENVIDGMAFLITIALQLHPEWVIEDKNSILLAAVRTRDKSLVQALLDKGANPTYCDPEYRVSETLFGNAARYGAKECAIVLGESCLPTDIAIGLEINDPYGYIEQAPATIFSIFLLDIFQDQADLSDDDFLPAGFSSTDYDDILNTTLHLMLQAGADVDAVFPITCMLWREFSHNHPIPLELRPTCLDLCYYYDMKVFSQLLPYSRRWNAYLTRGGVCMAALRGKDALSTYLDQLSTPSRIDTVLYLQMTLFEQFFCFGDTYPVPMPHHDRGSIARALIEYGVPLITPRSLHGCLEKMLHIVVLTASKYGLNENLVFLLEHLKRHGAMVTSPILRETVQRGGTEVLAALIQLDGSLTQPGYRALALAAQAGNYEAVRLLLRLGIDINCTAEENYGEPMTVLASLFLNIRGKIQDTQTRMWQLFVDNGASLRLDPRKTTCYELLGYILQRCVEAWPALNFLLQFEEVNQLAPPRWTDLLEMFLEKFEHMWRIHRGEVTDALVVDALLRRCARPVLQPILAMAITASCGERLINDLIDAGQDLNDYSNDITPLQAAAKQLNYELVSSLLRRGADINAPARGKLGRTALQHVCGADLPQNGSSDFAEIWCRRNRLARFLAANGADVNAPASKLHGATALQLICEWECHTHEQADRRHELLAFLLESGADVNAAPGISTNTGLQYCAIKGDLESAALLVQYGVDPNGYPQIRSREYEGVFVFSALDLSVEWGRLDMTQYLLNIGALSASPGTTGYQGAMDIAKAQNHHAVGELILRHVERLSQLHKNSPDLLVGHQRCIERHAVAVKEARARRQVARMFRW